MFYGLAILWMRMTGEVFTLRRIVIDLHQRFSVNVSKTQLGISENTVKGVILT